MHGFTSGLSNLFHLSISLFLWLSIYSFMLSVNTDSFTSFLIWMPFILFHFISFSWLLLFTHSVMSDCLRPHGLWHARLPCPLPPPRVHWNSCPLYWWCHPTISSSVIPFFSCLHSFPASGSLPMSQLFAIRWPKYWHFSFSNSPSNDYSGLIYFKIDWLDLLAV